MTAYLTAAKQKEIADAIRGASDRATITKVLDEVADALAHDVAAAGIVVKQPVIAALAATTNIKAVPASFADVAAVRTYLLDADMLANIEARLDALEAKQNAILAALKLAGVIASS